MEKKLPYETPKLAIIQPDPNDIITTSTPDHEWNDDNVMDEGWL